MNALEALMLSSGEKVDNNSEMEIPKQTEVEEDGEETRIDGE